jgi:serine/threonine protein kinase
MSQATAGKEATFASPLLQQPLDVFSCRAVTMFEKVARAGAGTYGTVYKARDKQSGEVVALKKLRMANEKEGFPLTSVREIKILKSINHINIVRLKDVVVGSKPDSIFLAFEYCENDLASLMDHMKRPFSESEIKCLLLQLLRAVAHLHSYVILIDFFEADFQFLISSPFCFRRFILHRDIKRSNILLAKGGICVQYILLFLVHFRIMFRIFICVQVF